MHLIYLNGAFPKPTFNLWQWPGHWIFCADSFVAIENLLESFRRGTKAPLGFGKAQQSMLVVLACYLFPCLCLIRFETGFLTCAWSVSSTPRAVCLTASVSRSSKCIARVAVECYYTLIRQCTIWLCTIAGSSQRTTAHNWNRAWNNFAYEGNIYIWLCVVGRFKERQEA